MFPFVHMLGTKLYMTGLGVIVALITFLVVSMYLSNKYRQRFSKLFYWLPLLLALMYIGGNYIYFVLNVGLFPQTYQELLILVSPYGFKFHFAGIIIGITIAIHKFLKKVRMYENKKIRADILFYSFTLSLVPLGIFLLLGDDFIGRTTSSVLGIKSLHPESALNKFNAVHPIGVFLSIAGLLSALIVTIRKKIVKKLGLGILGFGVTLFLVNIVLLFQQYPKYGVISMGSVTLDIKQYVSFLVIMLCIWVYHKRETYTNTVH